MAGISERIAIIDPHSECRRHLAEYLTSKGYYVISANNLAEANVMFAREKPDLIFADLSADEIRCLSQCQQGNSTVPIIASSRVHAASEVVDALRAGAFDFIIKPLDELSQVDEAIQRIFERIRLFRLNQHYRQELEETNKELKAGIAELKADQAAGRKVQMKMLPEQDKVIGSLQFEHLVKPSLYLSGDFLDYFNIDDRRVLFYIADVSGHGASSAFVTVLLKNLTNRLIRNYKRQSSDEISCPKRFMQRVNKELLDAGLGKHLTMFAGVLDIQTLELTYSVGAHFPMPILVTNGVASYLEGSGMPIGLFAEPELTIFNLTLPHGFKLFLFSDGILEVIRAHNLSEKENMLLEFVSKGSQTISSLSEYSGIAALTELPDDIAVLSITDSAIRQ